MANWRDRIQNAYHDQALNDPQWALGVMLSVTLYKELAEDYSFRANAEDFLEKSLEAKRVGKQPVTWGHLHYVDPGYAEAHQANARAMEVAQKMLDYGTEVKQYWKVSKLIQEIDRLAKDAINREARSR